MKIIKARYDLLFFFFFPFLSLSTLLYFFFFDQVASLSLTSWLLLIVLLILPTLPVASIPLGDQVVQSIKATWFLSLFLSQLLITILLWSICQLLRFDVTTQTFQSALNPLQLAIHSGLFPWPIATLTALTWGYYTYRKKQVGLYSSAFTSIFNTTFKSSIGIAVDSYVRFTSIFCSFILLAMQMMSLIALWPAAFDIHLSTGLTFPVAFASCLLLVIVANEYTVKFIYQLMYRKISLNLILTGLILCLSLLYPALDHLAHYLVIGDQSLKISNIYRSLTFYQDHMKIFVTLLWWVLSAMNGAYIAYISRNKSIRQIICCSLITFLFSLLILPVLDQIQIKYATMLFPLILLLASCTFMLSIIFSQKYRTYFMRATLPSNEPIKPRSIFRLLKMAPFIIICFTSIYFSLGVNVWSYIAVFGCLSTIIILLMGYVMFLNEVVKESL